MSNFFYALMVLCITNSLFSNVYWADKIIDASGSNAQQRSFNTTAYSPQQLLGKPSVMPNFGESVCAWMPQNIRRNDFLIVGFSTPINIEQVAVYENINPGAIVKITAYGESKDTLIYSNSNPVPTSTAGKMLNVYCDRTSFKVNRIRIDVNTYRYSTVYQIDAIAISDSKTPIENTINLSKDVSETGTPENLGTNINSRSSELAPVISPDGKTIYFTRERHPENTGIQSIWFAEIDQDGKFKPAKNIGKPLNTPYNNFAISILPDGNSMMVGNVYHPNNRLTNGFSMTYKKGDEWSFPEPFKLQNFMNAGGKGSYCLASSGRVLLSSIQGNGSYGNNDIYVSFLQEDSVWSDPINIGGNINTADREDSPFLAADGKTLYFSSAGYPGYGSSDIFVSKRLDDTWKRWSEPVNLGPKINTPEWDAYFTVTALGDYAYFVSIQNSIGNEDIFRVRLSEETRPEQVILVSGKVIDKKTNKPVAANIYYEKLENGESMGIARSNAKTGEYKIALPVGYKYGFRAEAKEYMAINENLDLVNTTTTDKEIERNLYIVPIEKDQAITINNLFFDFAQFQLLPESYPELDRLAKLMVENVNVKIRLEGHTDNVGSAQSNIELSEKRVDAVKEYLVNKSINSNRIQTKGIGAAKPIVSNKTDEGRAKNRRVECIITNK